MIIKNHYNKNRYCLTKTGLWVRDFTRTALPEDINNLIPSSDYDKILDNEISNAILNIADISSENVFAPNLIIVSDGYDFVNKQSVLKSFPQNKVSIIGVNRSLYKWGMQRRMDWYLTNNPYQECMSLLPKHDYYPRCIVSSRTNPNFIKKYRDRRGVVYKYNPVKDKNFSSSYFMPSLYCIDDYRNPICAVISLAYRWKVQKLLLFCCDDVFKDEREGTENVGGMWMYPQQKIAHSLIDGNLHWLLNNSEVKIANHSSGLEYDNAPYINYDKLLNFFDRE
jgi:hypothetical protein